jgi:hypothetical protein
MGNTLTITLRSGVQHTIKSQGLGYLEQMRDSIWNGSLAVIDIETVKQRVTLRVDEVAATELTAQEQPNAVQR